MNHHGWLDTCLGTRFDNRISTITAGLHKRLFFWLNYFIPFSFRILKLKLYSLCLWNTQSCLLNACLWILHFHIEMTWNAGWNLTSLSLTSKLNERQATFIFPKSWIFPFSSFNLQSILKDFHIAVTQFWIAMLWNFPFFLVDLKSRWEPIYFSISREVNIPLFNFGFGLDMNFSHRIDSCLNCDAWKFSSLFGRLEISMRANSLFSISREVNIPLFTDNINLLQSGFTLVWAQIPEESQREENILHHLNFVKRSVLWTTGKKV